MDVLKLKDLNPSAILDIGANTGEFSKACQLVWPDTYTYMIEANPECKAALEETKIAFQICLLADEKKQLTFFQRKCGGTSTGDSIYRENTPWYDDENIVETKMMATTLDIVCPPVRFDLVKIDCQGSELDILKGGQNAIAYTKHIIMEVPVNGVEPYNLGAPTRDQVMDYMKSIGFVKYEILGDIIHPIGRHLIQQDILFIK